MLINKLWSKTVTANIVRTFSFVGSWNHVKWYWGGANEAASSASPRHCKRWKMMNIKPNQAVLKLQITEEGQSPQPLQLIPEEETHRGSRWRIRTQVMPNTTTCLGLQCQAAAKISHPAPHQRILEWKLSTTGNTAQVHEDVYVHDIVTDRVVLPSNLFKILVFRSKSIAQTLYCRCRWKKAQHRRFAIFPAICRSIEISLTTTNRTACGNMRIALMDYCHWFPQSSTMGKIQAYVIQLLYTTANTLIKQPGPMEEEEADKRASCGGEASKVRSRFHKECKGCHGRAG